MNTTEISNTVKKLNKRADDAERFLKNLGEQAREEYKDDILKIEKNIKENRYLAKCFSDCLPKNAAEKNS